MIEFEGIRSERGCRVQKRFHAAAMFPQHDTEFPIFMHIFLVSMTYIKSSKSTKFNTPTQSVFERFQHGSVLEIGHGGR